MVVCPTHLQDMQSDIQTCSQKFRHSVRHSVRQSDIQTADQQTYEGAAGLQHSQRQSWVNQRCLHVQRASR